MSRFQSITLITDAGDTATLHPDGSVTIQLCRVTAPAVAVMSHDDFLLINTARHVYKSLHHFSKGDADDRTT